VEELAREAGMEPPDTDAAGATSNHEALLAPLARADRFFRRQLRQHPQRQRAVDYLRRRGLDGVTVRDFGIGYAPPGWDNLLRALRAEGIAVETLVKAGLAIARDGGGAYDRFRDRIMFPIRDRRGRTIAFGGRALDDATPKYLNSPESALFHKGRELYGLQEARHRQRQPARLLVVEGYMDVLALTQHGIDGAVATLGTATTGDHLERLFRVCRELVFCFDGDNAGREAAWRALEQTLPHCRDGRRIDYLFLPEGEDPDTLSRREGRTAFEQRLQQQALPLSDYFFRHLLAQTDLDSVDGRARLAELARPLLDKLPPGAYRELMQQQLQKHLQLPLQLLDARSPAPRRSRRAPTVPDVRRTLPRFAIALLLARPSVAANPPACLEQLRTVDAPGLALLAELVDLVAANPHITTGMLLERYRDTRTGRILERLAGIEPEIEDALLEEEFRGVLDKMKRVYLERHLFDRIARGELPEVDLERLRQSSRTPTAGDRR
ncbi:MAG: DNA primase, partial [Candidatus Competibacterales bacterium]|nr:DNA primase [Candidatus Competibacterales bacterium]